eukprot:366017-Chlamydomonas_euryale.AAC.8
MWSGAAPSRRTSEGSARSQARAARPNNMSKSAHLLRCESKQRYGQVRRLTRRAKLHRSFRPARQDERPPPQGGDQRAPVGDRLPPRGAVVRQQRGVPQLRNGATQRRSGTYDWCTAPAFLLSRTGKLHVRTGIPATVRAFPARLNTLQRLQQPSGKEPPDCKRGEAALEGPSNTSLRQPPGTPAAISSSKGLNGASRNDPSGSLEGDLNSRSTKDLGGCTSSPSPPASSGRVNFVGMSV